MRGGGGQLGGERVERSGKGGDCVCLEGVKKKEPVNRDCPVSAPRLLSVRLASPSIPVHPLSPAPSFAPPLEPPSPSVRTEIGSNAVRTDPKLGSEGVMNRVMNTFA